MGNINMNRQHPGSLLADSSPTAYGAPYRHAFSRLAASHRGQPAAEILPAAASGRRRRPSGFTPADLREQAEAISTGQSYTLRLTLD
ncbi:hypothetical protein ACFCZ1_33040 [Streptomyces sp. NPDC056224]|uniref:hypothetical protein n=1 Tax=Streptomyces sp. NPDC056224 TaxID=3345750 RepID=UPI0035D580E9